MAQFDIETLKSWNEKPERNTDWWRPQQGENKIRIIEAPSDSDKPSMYVAYKHFNIGPEKRSYWCRKSTGFKDKNWNESCPVCDYVSKLYDSGEEEDKKFASSMKASQRIILNIVDLNKPEDGVKLFECSKTLWDIMIKYWGSSKWGNLADADKGYDFIIQRDGAKSFPNYDKSYAVDDASPIQDRQWIEDMKDLREVVEIKDADFIASVLSSGIEPAKEEEKEEKDTPPWEPAPSGRSTTNAAPVVDKKEEATPEVAKPKKEKKHKKPPCFGEDYDETEDDCLECKWEDLCSDVAKSASSKSSDTLEDEIMAELSG